MRRRDERGATAVLVSLLMSGVLLASAAFAVDLGQQRVVRSDMQAVADLVAMDMARNLQAKAVSAYTSAERAEFDRQFAKSVDRNDSAIGGRLDSGDPSKVSWAFVVRDGSGWKELSRWSSGEVPDGIRVRARSKTGAAFSRSELAAGRSAVATMEPVVCFSAGANLADLELDSNVLVQALESFLGIDLLNLSLTAVGETGIVDLKRATIPLVDLAAALNVGSVEALLTSPTPISIGRLLEASATALDRQGTLVGANAALILEALKLNTRLSAPTIKVADIVKLAPGTGSALDATVGVLDLLQAFVFVAGKNAVGATAPISLPGLGTVDATVSVIETPTIACARPSDTPKVAAESAQVRVRARINLTSGTLITELLAGVDNTLKSLLTLGGLFETRQERIKAGTTATSVEVELTSARATAVLKTPGGLRCSDPASQTATLDVTTSTLYVGVGVRLTYKTEYREKEAPLYPWGDWQALEDVDDTLLTLGANLGDTTPSAVDLAFAPPPSEDLPSATKSTPLALALSVSTSQRTAIGGLVGALLTPVMDYLVNPLVSTLNTRLLPGLRTTLGLLGIELGKTTVKAGGRPTCVPRLIG
ncbi:hypothetical protein KG112_00760 [Nocardioides sp. zg-ZUI104]|uniref:hypothetical protein n=1 Tax=Nocardioides faecalis TaxID=2803858 RepID=UPI001BCBC4A0|nr:hypothetical protein [Nocardioides faecalis]MBS4751334.1 hypothetical protein [Nocardioides faecalis]